MTISAQAPFARLDIFGAPLVIGVVTGAGLISALLGDGVWDLLSWIALAVPLAVVGWAVARTARDRPYHEGRH